MTSPPGSWPGGLFTGNRPHSTITTEPKAADSRITALRWHSRTRLGVGSPTAPPGARIMQTSNSQGLCDVIPDARGRNRGLSHYAWCAFQDPRQGRRPLRGEEDRSDGAADDAALSGHVHLHQTGSAHLRFRE